MLSIHYIAKARLPRRWIFADIRKVSSLTSGQLSRCISLSMAASRPRIRLVLDFDGTITIDDTTAVIGSRCLAKARELARADLPEDKLPKPMSHYTEQYMHEYREWKSSFIWPSERKTIDDEVSHLSQSKRIEEDSFLRVKNATLNVPGEISELERNETMRNEFMKGAGRDAVRSGEVRIRDPEGLMKLIAKAEEEGNMWGIVSVSWSRRFILGALMEAGLVKDGQEEGMIQKIKCNELLASGHRDEEGSLNIICSAWDKQNALHELLSDWEDPWGAQQLNPVSLKDDNAVIAIYVGDSRTDIGCLAGPAIGVYLHTGDTEEDSVVQSLKRLGIKVLCITDLLTSNAPSKLTDMVANLRDEGKPPQLICLAQNFQQIDEWVSKLLTNSG